MLIACFGVRDYLFRIALVLQPIKGRLGRNLERSLQTMSCTIAQASELSSLFAEIGFGACSVRNLWSTRNAKTSAVEIRKD
jgi:hypothetical protein